MRVLLIIYTTIIFTYVTAQTSSKIDLDKFHTVKSPFHISSNIESRHPLFNSYINNVSEENKDTIIRYLTIDSILLVRIKSHKSIQNEIEQYLYSMKIRLNDSIYILFHNEYENNLVFTTYVSTFNTKTETIISSLPFYHNHFCQKYIVGKIDNQNITIKTSKVIKNSKDKYQSALNYYTILKNGLIKLVKTEKDIVEKYKIEYLDCDGCKLILEKSFINRH